MATSAEQSYSMEVHSQERFGFDCEFIERPPEALQSDCPVCMLVLREPHQVTCCGYAFCQEVVQLKAKQEENQSSLQAIRAHASVVPVELVLTEFRKHKRHSKEWYSEPFYTHPHGYKMCLRVDANGAGGAKGKYVSIFGYIMRGQFDIHLKWPFHGVVMVTLVNQLRDEEHFTYEINFKTAGTMASSRDTAPG